MISQLETHTGRATERPVTLAEIETRTAQYDSESAELEKIIADLESDLERVKQKYIARLKRQAGVVANREAELHSAIESAPELFVKPRTLTINGVKVGYTVSAGKLVFDDANTVVSLIHKYHKEEAEIYIRTIEEPNKDALKQLDIADLAKLGCRIEGAGDLVICKRVAGDVEKLVNKLIEKLVAAMVETE